MDPNLIYDVDGNVIENPDLSLGHIVFEQRVIKHHDAEPAVEEEFRWDVLEGTEDLHPGGLKHKVITKPGKAARDAWDEYGTVQIYHEYTPEELEAKNAPTQLDRIEAQVVYTAMMTDTMMEGVE